VSFGETLESDVRRSFAGPVVLGTDRLEIELGKPSTFWP
jgi:hypothetical protein